MGALPKAVAYLNEGNRDGGHGAGPLAEGN